MAITRDYLLVKPAGPSGWKLVLDQRVLPWMIDRAGSIEGGIERLAVATKRSPALSLSIGMGVGAGLGAMFTRACASTATPAAR